MPGWWLLPPRLVYLHKSYYQQPKNSYGGLGTAGYPSDMSAEYALIWGITGILGL
jgi:hypothetical protein